MSGLKSIELELSGTKDLALICNDDSVWLVKPIRWWDLATVLWWLFTPFDRKAKIRLTLMNSTIVRCTAVRVAKRHVKIRGISS